ncbi:MAG TPA: DUF4157 domain-containing protein [Terracidiphilus sp.]|nr:DUF4157 domain-containing protein [Terracidiphilus sp.]
MRPPLSFLPAQPSGIPVNPPGSQSLYASRLPVQCKLAVGSAQDPLEAEADAVAERITRTRAAAPPPAARPQSASFVAPRELPPIVPQVLRAPGQALEPATRSLMESRFQEDFSRVRIHSNQAAGESARAIHAHAYTLGNDIVFAPGKYNPSTGDGARLLAHELAHTLQQRPLSHPAVIRRDPDDKSKPPDDQSRAQRKPAPVNDISDNPMHEEREITAFDVTPGNKRPWNLNLLTKTIVNALRAEDRAYIRIEGVFPTIAGEDDPKENAYERAETVRRALIQWIGPGKFADDRFEVVFADGQIGDPQIRVNVAYHGVNVSNPALPELSISKPMPSPNASQKTSDDDSSDIQSAIGGQWTWHMNRPGKADATVQLQLTRGSGAAQELYQFQVDPSTGDMQFLAGAQLQKESEAKTVEILKGAIKGKVKASVFLDILGGITRAGGSASGSLTFQIQAGAQVTAVFGSLTVALQVAPSITYQAGQPIALDFNVSPQAGMTSLPNRNFPPFLGIPIIVGTF